MRNGLAVAALVTISAMLAPAVASAKSDRGAPIPSGAKSAGEPGRWTSPKGFRDTVDWYRKELDKQKLIVEFTPVERVRDVVFTRVISKDRASAWQAIHIVLAEGRTGIYILSPESGK